uniref:Uncharacterized protein n=1 Tax=Salix viminalis TaxID=40686 RepID=A0A6N2N331_SALVM
MHQSIRIYISKFLRNSWNGNGEKSLYIRRCITTMQGYSVFRQEVDRFDDLDDLLQKDGFRGAYKARTGEACDGCAVFWKDKLFTLLHEEHVEFQSFGLRNNVAQLCVFKMNENQSETGLSTEASKTTSPNRRSLVVGNIHVLFNPNRGDIKLGQVRIFLERAYKLSQEWATYLL